MPTPPSEINAAVPDMLSAIVMHLLEKEPDDRYQSADGVLYDLRQLSEGSARAGAVVRVGERDFPPRLIGRDDEVVALQAAFDDALSGGCRGVLVGGASGVGKTALVDQLRPVVTGNDGWLVAGKFDQYRRDLEFDGLEVADNGVGGADFAHGTGLVGLKDRVEALGGHIHLQSPSAAGTSLRVWLPLSQTSCEPSA